eukprot:767714-Alexandrium_andersonii.AAC.1
MCKGALRADASYASGFGIVLLGRSMHPRCPLAYKGQPRPLQSSRAHGWSSGTGSCIAQSARRCCA